MKTLILAGPQHFYVRVYYFQQEFICIVISKTFASGWDPPGSGSDSFVYKDPPDHVGCCLQLLGEVSAFFSAPPGSRGVAAGSVCLRGEMEG